MKKKNRKKIHTQKEPGLNFELVSVLAIVFLGIAIYSNSFDCSFHFDDIGDIVGNSAIQDISNVHAVIKYAPIRFIGFFTFALNYYLHQYDVWGYHVLNLIIHILSAVLVWWLINLTLSTPVIKDNSLTRHKKIISLLAGLLFVSHPIQTQAVTYIVQRLASLATFFYFLSMALYLKGRIWKENAKQQKLLFIGTGITAILAMFTKEIAFTLPLAILGYEFFFFNTNKIIFRKLILIFIPLLLVIPICYLWISDFHKIFETQSPEQGHFYTLTAGKYLMTQFRVIVTYLRLLVFPINQNLDYDYPVAKSLFETPTISSLIFLITILLLGVVLFKKYRFISFGIFFFFLTLSVESSIIPIQNVIFEHRLYLPSFGFIIFLLGIAYYFFWKKDSKKVIGVLILIITFNSVLTFERNKVWKNEFTLWNDAIKKSPYKARPYNNRGKAFLDIGNKNKALEDFTKAIEINPDYMEALNNRGALFLQLNKLEKAITDLNNCINIKPRFIPGRYNRARVFIEMKEYEQALQDLNVIINLYPAHLKALLNRGTVYSLMGKDETAISDFESAMKLKSDDPQIYNNRGIALKNLGRYPEALNDYNTALKISPNSIQLLYNRGIVHTRMKNYSEAIDDFTKIIELDQHNIQAYFQRAFVYSNIKEYDKSNSDLMHIIRLNPDYVDAYINMGLNFANLQQWEQAIQNYSKALNLNNESIPAYLNRAVAYFSIGDYQKSWHDVEKTQKLGGQVYSYLLKELENKSVKK